MDASHGATILIPTGLNLHIEAEFQFSGFFSFSPIPPDFFGISLYNT